jgi:methyl coenzyme M reductase subunit C-like uncharacterized protein (methanogenesis marker protein 7)
MIEMNVQDSVGRVGDVEERVRRLDGPMDAMEKLVEKVRGVCEQRMQKMQQQSA